MQTCCIYSQILSTTSLTAPPSVIFLISLISTSMTTSAQPTSTQIIWTPSWQRKSLPAAWTAHILLSQPTAFSEVISAQPPLALSRSQACPPYVCFIHHHSKEDHLGISTNSWIDTSTSVT